MKYVANPVEVDAWVISRVTPHSHVLNSGGFTLERDGQVGSDFEATPEMCSRMTPRVGDYIVRQSDGYIYLNPKDVFERKYHVAPEQPAAHAAS